MGMILVATAPTWLRAATVARTAGASTLCQDDLSVAAGHATNGVETTKHGQSEGRCDT